MVKKMRVSLALQPVAAALFANSPFTEGKPNGYLSFRSAIWLDTDAARSGMLPFAFEDGMGYERYVDYALDVPMYFVRRDNRYIDLAGASFRDFLDGRLPQLPGEKPTLTDWADHLTTLFPEVRLKRFLEMRGADSGTCRSPLRPARVLDRPALPSVEPRRGLRSRQGLDGGGAPAASRCRAPPRAQNAIPQRRRSGRRAGSRELAAAGLKARGYTDLMTGDESIFLQPLAEILEIRADLCRALARTLPWRMGRRREAGVCRKRLLERFRPVAAVLGNRPDRPLPRDKREWHGLLAARPSFGLAYQYGSSASGQDQRRRNTPAASTSPICRPSLGNSVTSSLRVLGFHSLRFWSSEPETR